MDKDKKVLNPDVKVGLSRFEKKKPIQLMSISYLNIPAFSKTDSILINTRIAIKRAIKKYLKTGPKFALLFTDNFDVFKLRNILPCDTLILNLPNLIIESQYSNSLLMEPTGEKPRSIANSLLLVEDECVKIKYDFHYLDDSDVNAFITRLLTTEDYEQTLILFSSGIPFPTIEIAKKVRALTDKTIDLIHESCCQRCYTCWGGEARMFLNDAHMTSRSDQPFIFGLNIYGSNVKSYSALIDTENTEDFTRQATYIRQSIKGFKRYSIGFVNTTKEVTSRKYYLECIDSLKKIFPETTFTCLSRFQEPADYILPLNRVLGYDSHNKDAKPLMETDCLMSLLIVTFDRNNYSGSEDFQLVNDDGEIEGTVEAAICNRERPANKNSAPQRKENVSKIEENEFELVNDDGEIEGTVKVDISNRERPANKNSTPRRKENVSKIEEKVSDERILIEKKNKAIDKTTVKTIQASPAKLKANKMDKENKKKEPQK